MAIKFKNFDEEAEKRAKEIGAVKKNTATSSNTIAGVDSSITEKAYNSDFKESDDVKNAVSESGTALGKVKDLTSKGQLVSDDTWDSLGKKFSTPNSVRQADSYLNSQLQKIQSGKTSYSDQVRDMMDTIMGREKFTYDVDKDPLFQQALASAMGSGKQAMQDTIGQASALTGGYGSSYATTAGNQAYNAFIEDAYNNLPQYYQMAMEAYQMEGDDLYRQLDMLTSADEREYSRNVTAYDATYQHRNQMYNEAYQQFRDAKTDAYNIANLKLSEHGQLVNDAYNYFNASADYANTLYEREYNKWADEVNQAMKWAEMLNSDWWKNTEFGEGVRQYDKDYAQKDEHLDKNLEHEVAMQDDDQVWKSGENALGREHEVTMQDNAQVWNDSNREDNQKHDVTMQDDAQAFTSSENGKYKTSGGGSGSGSGSGSGDYSITNTEYNALNKIVSEASSEKEAWDKAIDYLEAIGKAPQNNEESEIIRRAMFGEGSTTEDGTSEDGTSEDGTSEDGTSTKSGIDWDTVSITKTKDTWNGFLGLGGITGHVDTNDEFNVNGQIYTTEELEQMMIDDGIDEKKRNTILRNISGLSNNSSYSFNGK